MGEGWEGVEPHDSSLTDSLHFAKSSPRLPA